MVSQAIYILLIMNNFFRTRNIRINFRENFCLCVLLIHSLCTHFKQILIDTLWKSENWANWRVFRLCMRFAKFVYMFSNSSNVLSSSRLIHSKAIRWHEEASVEFFFHAKIELWNEENKLKWVKRMIPPPPMPPPP